MAGSIECREVAPYTDPAAVWTDDCGADSRPVQALFYAQVSDILMDFCQQEGDASTMGWAVSAAPASETQGVVSAVPGLLLSGEHDVLTPPAWDESALAGMVSGHHRMVPETGHNIVDNRGMTGLVQASLDAPDQTPTLPCCTGVIGNRAPSFPRSGRGFSATQDADSVSSTSIPAWSEGNSPPAPGAAAMPRRDSPVGRQPGCALRNTRS